MSDSQTVVYTAGSSQEAHFLKNLLAEAGITAFVANDLLERGSGVDIVGWATAARVLVADEDAPRARQIALEFDRRAADAARTRAPEGPPPELPPGPSADWPKCPQCGARRSTMCPVCGTAGSDFPPADMGFVWIPEADAPARQSASCSCGPGGCTPEASQPEAPAADQAEGEQPAALLMCPTCDEAFAPAYPRLCEWCGHEFADGFEVPLPTAPVEQINSRVIAVIIVLLALAAAAVVYLAMILY
jgi:hypothetical protein